MIIPITTAPVDLDRPALVDEDAICRHLADGTEWTVEEVREARKAFFARRDAERAAAGEARIDTPRENRMAPPLDPDLDRVRAKVAAALRAGSRRPQGRRAASPTTTTAVDPTTTTTTPTASPEHLRAATYGAR